MACLHLYLQPFVLHDGPPYANGPLHMGHALNKVLKDIVNRYNLLRGKHVVFVPGWDCHGLPIELKALESHPDGRRGMSHLQIRAAAKAWALAAIETQKADFIRWGVMADWVEGDGQGYYTTMAPQYEAAQLGEMCGTGTARTRLFRGGGREREF